MFDVAFSELIVIAVVALIVIGPEKLPKVARTLGALTGRMQRYVAQVREEVNREVRFQELQQLQQEIQETALKTQTDLQQKTQAVMHDLQPGDMKIAADTHEATHHEATGHDVTDIDRSSKPDNS